MIRNYYTLLKLSEELQSICGMKIVECFTQDKNTLLLALYDNSDIVHLNFSADTKLGALFLRNNFNRANKNSVDLFDFLLGQSILSISLERNDRIITLTTNDYIVYIILFGGPKNNFIITDKNNIVIASFKSSDKLKGKADPLKIFAKQSVFKTELSLFDELARGRHNLGKHYAVELGKRLGLELDEKYIENTELLQAIEKIENEITSSDKYYLLIDDKGLLLLSLIPLADRTILEAFTSLSKAIERRIRKELIEGNIESERKIILKKLNTQKSRLEKNIANISTAEKQLERAGDYRHWAELLLQQPNQKIKPGNKISLTDWDGENIEFKLNPKKTINENAQMYFEKAKNTESNYKIRKEMLPSLLEKVETIKRIIDEIEKTDTVKRIKKIKEENAAIFGEDNLGSKGGERFRTFDLGEGYMLYVGKNAANNDELTLRFAKPNDLWFHARGSSGSHAVLRMHKAEKPPKYILKKAASIAAYYSGAKNAKYVPVSYTFKKFVHKPKGANPGAVVIKREDVIMVEPKLPASE